MDFMEFGKVKLCNPSQKEKVLSFMEVTELGMFMSCKDKQL
jgi:hypothetical protein